MKRPIRRLAPLTVSIILATTLGPAARAQSCLQGTPAASHPDRVYPIPENYGGVERGGINLLTGDVNLNVELASLESGPVSYSLSGFYNSRSSWLDGDVDNALGGCGWKLLDYPKIVQDGADYLLLDGRVAWPLESLGNDRFGVGGPYVRWRIVTDGASPPGSFALTTDEGNVMTLGNTSNDAAYAQWNLSQIAYPNWGAALSFAYSGARLSEIASLSGDRLSLSYDGARLSTIASYSTIDGVETELQSLSLEYNDDGGSYGGLPLLLGFNNSYLLPNGSFAAPTAGTSFEYFAPSEAVPLALEHIFDEHGATTHYLYYSGSRTAAHPTIRFAIDDGYSNNTATDSSLIYTAVWYNFTNGTIGGDGIYPQYNEIRVYPGGLYKAQDPVPSDPYGHTDFYLFNGAVASNLVELPSYYTSEGIDVTSNALRGLLYLDESYATDDETTAVSASTFYRTVEQTGATAATAFNLLDQSTITEDQVSETVNYSYDPTTYLPVEILRQRLNPQVEEGGGAHTELVQTSIVYAYQVYNALGPDGLHVLDTPAQVTVAIQEPDDGAFEIESSNTTQWKSWGTDPAINWAPVAQYLLRAPIDSDQLATGFDAEPPAEQWQLVTETIARTDYGLVELQQDAARLPTSTLYSATWGGTVQVASFNNADVGSGEAGYWGMESYEDGAAWSGDNGALLDTIAHTGLESYGGADAFTVAPASFAVVAGVAYVVAAYVQPSPAASCTVGFLDGSSWNNQQTVSATAEESSWQYVQITTDGTSFSGEPTVSCSAGAIDDLRFGPLNGSFSAVVYDPETRLSSATLGANGQTNFQVRDPFGRLAAAVGPSGQARALQTAYNSPLGNRTFSGEATFDPAQPNAELETSTPSGGSWEGFTFSDNPSFPPSSLSTEMSLEGGALQVGSGAATDPATATFGQSVSDSEFALRVAIGVVPASDAVDEASGLCLDTGGSEPVCISIEQTAASSQFVLTDGSGDQLASVSLANLPQQTVLMAVVLGGNQLFAYADGRSLFDHEFAGTLGGTVELVSSNPGGYFDNFVYITDPALTLLTFDASMRQRQSLSQNNPDTLHIAQALYGGALNLQVASSRLAALGTDSGLSYQTDFVEFDEPTLTVTGGTIRDPGVYDYSQPYDSSELPTRSPRLQTQSVGSGGVNSAGGSGAIDYSYQPNPGSEFDFNAGELVVTATAAPDGLTTSSYSDLQGVTYGLLSQGEDGSSQQQQFTYDNLMRRTGDFQPNYFSPGIAQSQAFATTYGYDFLGSTTFQQTADSGTRLWAYDSSRAPRLQLTADGTTASSPYLLYWKYDDQGRLLEQGQFSVATLDATVSAAVEGVVAAAGKITVESGVTLSTGSLALAAGNGVVLEPGVTVEVGAELVAGISGEALSLAYAESLLDPDWPNDDTTPNSQYSYDVNTEGQSDGWQGRLASVTIDNDTATVVESYAYDLTGNTTCVATSLTDDQGATSAAAFGYGYDLQQHLAWIGATDDCATAGSSSEPPAGAVTYLHDTLGRVTAIGTSTDPTFYAEYSYGNGIVTEILNAGTVTRSYTTDESGNPQAVDDPFFSETLFYATRSDGSDGYLNGQIASAVYDFKWSGAPAGYDYQYYYDDLGRLTVAASSNTSGNSGVATPLAYDPNGNILTFSQAAVISDYAYEPGTNRVAGTGTGASYGYDANGNVTSAEARAITAIAYDPVSQLTTSLEVGGDTISFAYGSRNRRVLKTSSSGESRTVYGLSNQPLARTITPSSGTPVEFSYVYGPQGLLAVIQDGETYFVLKDHLGSSRVVIDSNNAVQAYFNYLPFGELWGATSDSGTTVELDYLFTGQELDTETGLYNFQARLYDPALARFYAPDPQAQLPTPYAYAGNNPISVVDPSGEWGFWSVAGVIAGTAAVVAGTALVVTGVGAGAGAALAIGGFALANGSFLAGSDMLSTGATVTTASAGGGAHSSLVGATGTSYRTTPMNNAYVGEDRPGNAIWGTAVEYLDSSKRRQYELFVKGSLLVDSNGVAYDTSASATAFSGGRAIFVMDRTGQIYASTRHAVGKFHHSSFLSGQPVASAGELVVDHGKLKLVSNKSGHYHPTCALDDQVLSELRDRGLNVAGVTKDCPW